MSQLGTIDWEKPRWSLVLVRDPGMKESKGERGERREERKRYFIKYILVNYL
jgi:hypothetical protein